MQTSLRLLHLRVRIYILAVKQDLANGSLYETLTDIENFVMSANEPADWRELILEPCSAEIEQTMRRLKAKQQQTKKALQLCSCCQKSSRILCPLFGSDD